MSNPVPQIILILNYRKTGIIDCQVRRYLKRR
jgi:hypothetical protein